MHRGVSIISKSNKKFDLYLHGAVGDDTKNRMKIGADLEQDAFYTLQVCWKEPEINTGYYSLYKYKQLLFDRVSFKHNTTTPEVIVPAFYLGGFNAAKDWSSFIKSKCFTGMISNIEVIQTQNSFSNDLLQLIIDKQSVFDPWYELKNNEEDEPPAQ